MQVGRQARTGCLVLFKSVVMCIVINTVCKTLQLKNILGLGVALCIALLALVNFYLTNN